MSHFFSYDYFPSTERRQPSHRLSSQIYIKQKNNFDTDEGLEVIGALTNSFTSTELEGGTRDIKSEERFAKLMLLYLNRSGIERSFGNLARPCTRETTLKGNVVRLPGPGLPILFYTFLFFKRFFE
jgi:hypothetical protein